MYVCARVFTYICAHAEVNVSVSAYDFVSSAYHTATHLDHHVCQLHHFPKFLEICLAAVVCRKEGMTKLHCGLTVRRIDSISLPVALRTEALMHRLVKASLGVNHHIEHHSMPLCILQSHPSSPTFVSGLELFSYPCALARLKV